MSADLARLDPRLKPAANYLLRVLTASGLTYTVTSVYRSATAQAKLYAAYRAGRSPLPAAPPGRSLHQQGRAFDLQIFPYPQWQAAAGALWRRMGGRWYASDNVHFEG